jgi:antitoxin ParD1/3/4
METMNIALPPILKAFVQEQVDQGGYSSASEYIRRLIREDQERKVRERIEAKLLEALDSGDPIEVTPEFWEARRQELKSRLQRQGKAES